MIQLAIFDWDGTLMDSALNITRCIQAAARDLSLFAPTHEQAKVVIGLGLEEAMQQLFPDSSSPDIKQLVDAYRHHSAHSANTEQELFDGVLAGLHRINARGTLMAVATGKSRAGLDRALDQAELRGYFVTTRCADEARSKPHPQMLHDILDFTAIEPHKTIMIGDTTFDMDMAHNANIAGLAVSYGVHDQQSLEQTAAVSIAHSFEEVIACLERKGLEAAFS